jgi:hypothetical protein
VPFLRQRLGKSGLERDVGPRRDDDVREVEERPPAVPARKPVERVGADEQQQRPQRRLGAKLGERVDRVALAAALDLERIDW